MAHISQLFDPKKPKTLRTCVQKQDFSPVKSSSSSLVYMDVYGIWPVFEFGSQNIWHPSLPSAPCLIFPWRSNDTKRLTWKKTSEAPSGNKPSGPPWPLRSHPKNRTIIWVYIVDHGPWPMAAEPWRHPMFRHSCFPNIVSPCPVCTGSIDKKPTWQGSGLGSLATNLQTKTTQRDLSCEVFSVV